MLIPESTIVDMSYWFYNCISLETIDLSGNNILVNENTDINSVCMIDIDNMIVFDRGLEKARNQLINALFKGKQQFSKSKLVIATNGLISSLDRIITGKAKITYDEAEEAAVSMCDEIFYKRSAE